MSWLERLFGTSVTPDARDSDQDTAVRALALMANPAMIADANGHILAANTAFISLCQTPAIRQQLPELNSTNVAGYSAHRLFQALGVEAPHGMLSFSMAELTLGAERWVLQSSSLQTQRGTTLNLVQWFAQPHASAAQQLFQQLAVLQLDPNGQIKSSNAPAIALLGPSAAHDRGRDFMSLWHATPQQLETCRQLLRQLQQGQRAKAELATASDERWCAVELVPLTHASGQLLGSLCVLTDATRAMLEKVDQVGQMKAIHMTQAVIEFTLDGIILTANTNFLSTLGYSLEEIKGQHHRMFVDEQYTRSAEYQEFWRRLKAGEFFVNEYKRFGKGGKEIWIQASYNPIFDADGKPFKVVKYATDITQRKLVVNEIKRVMMQLSGGDLQTRIEHTFVGEFAELGHAINGFIQTLRQMVTDIHAVAFAITGATHEISDGNTDLASRTEQQASSLEETASSMEEFAGTVRQNSEHSKQANMLSGQASEIAVGGGELISKVVTTMASINESAQRISDIIGVIDGIAFQTNILALNAAVEAARAGEQGRGFAVVASEVRSLAQRSANAAKDIKTLISDSVAKIRTGHELVERSGITMQDVVLSIKRVNDLMSDIAAASQAQTAGIDEVNKAITQMDAMTQQNAALVEQAAAAAESLVSQAEQLTEKMSFFQLGGEALRHQPPRQPQIQARRVDSNVAVKKPVNAIAKAASRPVIAPTTKREAITEQDEWEQF